MRRSVLVVLGVLACALILSACGANRPEGPAELFLNAVSRSTDLDQVQEYGTLDAAEELVGEPLEESRTDQELLVPFEVAPTDRPDDAVEAEVPSLVLRDTEDERRVELRSALEDGQWLIVDVTPLTDDVVFPSEGGPGYGIDPGVLVALVLVVLVGTIAVTVTAIAIWGRPHRRSAEHT